MLNKVTLQGNIGRAPKIALTQDGREIASFSLATSESWKDKTGEWQTHTDWHRITVFRQSIVRWMKGVFQQGAPVLVEGKLGYSRWTDKYGQDRITSHVVITEREGGVQLLLSHFSRSQDPNLNANPSPDSNSNLTSILLSQRKEASPEEPLLSEPGDDCRDIPLEVTQEDACLSLTYIHQQKETSR